MSNACRMRLCLARRRRRRRRRASAAAAATAVRAARTTHVAWPHRVGKSTTRVRRAWTTATTVVAYTHARDISHHISPSFSRVVTRASNAARRTAAPIMARRWLTLTRTRAIFATVGRIADDDGADDDAERDGGAVARGDEKYMYVCE